MADDAAMVEQLQAELGEARTEIDSLRQREVTFVEDGERRDRAFAEALDQQAATAEVLRVIASSPTDLQDVLQTIIDTAARLCAAPSAALLQLRERDGQLAPRAIFGSVPLMLENERDKRESDAPDFDSGLGSVVVPTSMPGRAYLEQRTIHVHDMASAVKTEYPDSTELQVRLGLRSVVFVPLLRDATAIGVLSMQRYEVCPFTEPQIRLLETFADQAVIAIENARLFGAIEEKSRQLEVASQHKSQFLANMSHELRTPLNAIIGYSEMLQEEAEDLDADAFLPDLQKINAAGKHLLGLINDILDLSRIEAGRMDLFLETFDISDLARGVMAIVQPLVEKNANSLVVSCADDLGTMRSDQTKVRQTLFNLMSNASKFTEQGTISLSVAREASDESDWITFAVADTGIGMTDEQLGRLFEAFSQAEASTRSKYGGTGLGLAISRHFCRLMGGDLNVTSVYGQGSTFAVRLPAVVSEPA
jgi:signal transduction histidine kinase